MKKILPLIFPLALVLISLFLAFRNYTSGTFLIGWDSLHPEFNFPEAFSRVLNGVWREEQGLGAIAAHSHMADWPRILFLFLESFVLPATFLRYSYVFLCLVLGPLGIYFFLNYVFRQEREGAAASTGAFLGSLYYLLNLGTLQHFFVPFEMFTTQFAFLPWLFYAALRFLREGKKKNLIFFAILAIISSPQAYAATLFYAYLGALTIFALSYMFKRGLVLVLISILLNSYWILPNIYSVINQSGIVVSANINRLFSSEAYLRNLSFGNIQNIVIHRNFLFDWRAFGFEKGQFENLIGNWNFNPFYIFALCSTFGVLFSIFKRGKLGFSLFAVSAYAFFFLLGFYPEGGVPGEALRMPFTKFSIIFIFVAAYFFGYFFFKLSRKAFLGLALTLVVSASLIFSAWPMFQGQLISPVVRRNLPDGYFELFDWFKGKEGRIAALPLNTLWGWDYHSWKYEGSGFLTYGLKNPLLVRDFDRWSPYNEGFYAESARAIYASDNEAFKKVLQKYQVKYLLLDESIINAGGSLEVLFIPEIKKMIGQLGIREVAKFNFLSVYDTQVDAENVSAPETYMKVNVNLDYSQVDPIYAKYGDYIQDNNALGYPFVNFDHRGDVKIGIMNDELRIMNGKTNSEVRLPIQGKITEAFGEGRGFSEASNCDLKKLGRVEKEGATYRAFDGGVSCDFFEYPGLKHDQAYVLRFKGENKKGRSLKIYLQNWETNRMDLEELLPGGKFDEYYFIYPAPSNSAGFSLNLETRSFGRIASENTVSAIEFYPVDYRFLSEIYTGEGGVVIRNNLKINNVKKYGTAIYKVDINLPVSATPKALQAGGVGLIQLGQGYEPGWVAFQGNTKLEHVKVNSWANGWIVPSDTSVIYIVFWSQLLEWGGMALGLVVLVGMLTKFRSQLY